MPLLGAPSQRGRNPPRPIQTSARSTSCRCFGAWRRNRSPDLTAVAASARRNERLLWAAWAASRTWPCLWGKGEALMGCSGRFPGVGGGLRCNLEVTEEPATPGSPSQSQPPHPQRGFYSGAQAGPSLPPAAEPSIELGSPFPPKCCSHLSAGWWGAGAIRGGHDPPNSLGVFSPGAPRFPL